MQSDVKIGLVAPIIGFLIGGIYLLMVGIGRLNSEYDFLSDIGSLNIPILVCGVTILIVAFISMFKLQMIEGMTFFMISLAAICVGTSSVADVSDVFRLIVVIMSMILIFMSYRVGDLHIMLFNILMVIAFIAAMNSLDYGSQGIVVGIILILGSIIALYISVSEWMFLQDVTMDYTEDEEID